MSKKEKLEKVEGEKLTPIKKELRPLLEEFLLFEPYQDLFLSFTRSMGYQGDDMERVRQLLFAVKDGEIGFNILGLNDLFLEFQLLKSLSGNEPYKTLLEEHPEAIRNVRELAKKILKKEEIQEKDLKEVFDTTNYDRNEKE